MNNNSVQPAQTKTTARDFFLYLGVVILLAVNSIGLLRLIFDIINRYFPDKLSYSFDDFSIRSEVALLIILFPIFIFISRFLLKDLRANPEKSNMAIRKWLLYLTLFVSGFALAIDLVVLVYTFLGGEITTRFVLKVASVLLVTGAIFGYYLYDVRKGAEAQKNVAKFFALGALAVILLSIIGGFLIVGSPSAQRAKHFDEVRINDLQSIQWQVVNYWQSKGVLPKNISDINDPISGFVIPSDPDTKKAYEYHLSGEKSFSLCAEFTSSSTSSEAGIISPKAPVSMPGGVMENWNHNIGRTCFERNIDPQLYPVRKNN